MIHHVRPVMTVICLLASLSSVRAQDDSLDARGFKIRRTDSDGKEKVVTVPRGYALVIGVGEYQNLEKRYFLRFAQSDAQAVYRTLISKEGGAFPPENVHLLIGHDATRENIRKELEEWLPSVAKEPDRVVVYFSGHGVVDHGAGYLVPYDLDANRLSDTGYSMKRLGAVMTNQVKARWKVLLADACHSGKITPETSNETVEATFGELPKTFLTFSATRENEQSFEDPNLDGGFGLFSYFLVQGLSGKADQLPCDGVVTADELIDYVRTEVRNYARQRQKIQTPNERGDFADDMILGLGKGCSGQEQVTKRLNGTLVIEANMDDVTVTVDGQLMQGTVKRAQPLRLPGIPGGVHLVVASHQGYEPVTKHVPVVPGEERTVTIQIQYPQHTNKAVQDLVERGERVLFGQRSGWNPLEIYHPAKPDYSKARDLFRAALEQEPNYPRAAYGLATVDILLSKESEAVQYFEQVIKDDPSDVEARVEYAGASTEAGDPDEAIRLLVEAQTLEPKSDLVFSFLARAYLDKGVWDRAVDYSSKAISLKSSNAQAYLWRAEAYRRMAAADKTNRAEHYQQANDDFHRFLRFTDFSTPVGSSIVFYFFGFGQGSRNHADRRDSYEAFRSTGFIGACICGQKLGQLQSALKYCKNAVALDARDATAHFFLGNVYRDLFNRTLDADKPQCDYLMGARGQYVETVAINPDIQESVMAKSILTDINRVAPSLHCQVPSDSAGLPASKSEN